ncbi:MAG: class I SAM-dependent methyltransferase [Mucilaginibacter sp.]
MPAQSKKHWENVYNTKQPHEVSWTQAVPTASLNFIHNLNISKDAAIIDIGGGDSNLADFLLDEGYTNISVLDISETALQRAKARLGDRASLVTWLVSDITAFLPEKSYDVWHDRATFHFLTKPQQIKYYMNIARQWVKGYIIIGTFSTKGPLKCSGLEVKQYDEAALTGLLQDSGFEKLNCTTSDHITPFNTSQNFLFCSFRRRG